jgi:hypothetical protein
LSEKGKNKKDRRERRTSLIVQPTELKHTLGKKEESLFIMANFPESVGIPWQDRLQGTGDWLQISENPGPG